MEYLKNANTHTRYAIYGAAGLLGTIFSYYFIAKPTYRHIKKHQFAYLKEMELMPALAQWIIIYGQPKGIISSYLKKLKQGGLRVCFICMREEDCKDLKDIDKVLEYNKIEEIKEFLSTRHIKIFINAISLSTLLSNKNDDTTWSLLKNTTNMIEQITENMGKNKGGVIITLIPKIGSPMQKASAEHFSIFSKGLVQNTGKITAQKVYLNDKEIDNENTRIAEISLDSIGLEENI